MLIVSNDNRDSDIYKAIRRYMRDGKSDVVWGILEGTPKNHKVRILSYVWDIFCGYGNTYNKDITVGYHTPTDLVRSMVTQPDIFTWYSYGNHPDLWLGISDIIDTFTGWIYQDYLDKGGRIVKTW